MCDPARGGMLEGGGSGRGFPPRHGCCVQAHDKICDPAPEGVLERGSGGPGGGLPPGTAAVSKHGTCTVTKQTTGARGGGPWCFPPRHSCCVQARDRYYE